MVGKLSAFPGIPKIRQKARKKKIAPESRKV